jgi:hypothetical protein
MKSPPVQYTDGEAHDLVEAFIKDEVITMASALRNGNGVVHGNGHVNGHINGNGNGNGHISVTDEVLRTRP